MSRKSVAPIFSNVDASGYVAHAIDLLDVQHETDYIRRSQQRALAALSPTPGAIALDAGCGVGTFNSRIAATGALVIGIDNSLAMIRQALARQPIRDVNPCFQPGDVAHLQFQDASFDLYYAERVYQHLIDPKLALNEAHRTLKPGGRLVVLEPDHESVTIDTPLYEVNRKFIDWRCGSFKCGTAARRLPGWCREVGFARVVVELLPVVFTDYETRAKVAPYLEEMQIAVAESVVTAQEAEAWNQHLIDAIAGGRFLATQVFSLTVATKSQ